MLPKVQTPAQEGNYISWHVNKSAFKVKWFNQASICSYVCFHQHAGEIYQKNVFKMIAYGNIHTHAAV